MKQKLAIAIGIAGSAIGAVLLLVSFFMSSIIMFIAGVFVILTSLLAYIFLNILDKGFHFKAKIPVAAILSVLYVGLAAYAAVIVVNDNKAGGMDPGMNMGDGMTDSMDGGLDTGLDGIGGDGLNTGNLADPTSDNPEGESNAGDETGEGSSEESSSGEDASNEETSGEESTEGAETSGETEETTQAPEAVQSTTSAPRSNNSISETAVAIPMPLK